MPLTDDCGWTEQDLKGVLVIVIDVADNVTSAPSTAYITKL